MRSLLSQAGHEQSGRRPALVVSHDLFNRKTGLIFVCPVTRTVRGYPFHVAIPDGSELTGFVMLEQMRNVDYRARQAKRVGQASQSVLEGALALLDACLYWRHTRPASSAGEGWTWTSPCGGSCPETVQ